jgi:Uncharacterised protein family, YAP/Alf4/glomulin
VDSIAWDVVGMIVPFLGNGDTVDSGSKVLDLLVMKGNAKEVFLKGVEALKGIQYSRDLNEEEEEEEENEATLAEKLSKFKMESPFEIDPVQQTTHLYKALLKSLQNHNNGSNNSIPANPHRKARPLSNHLGCIPPH